MSGSALILRADALRLPLPDESVDLVVSSPPYFALRSYRDGDEHYAGQIGSEPTPQAFLEALWAVMAECWRVLKPTGSCFINLGDKRAGSGGHNNGGLTGATSALGGRSHTAERDANRATRRNAPDRYNQAAFGRAKSKMLLPHRFAIGCEDGMADPEGKGWIMRSDIVWQKLNGLPESVTDRCRDSHEYLFHFTKEGRYFAAVDEVREAYDAKPQRRLTPQPQVGAYRNGQANGSQTMHGREWDEPMAGTNPLGKLPGSVWPLASEPLIISDEVKAHYDLPDHFACLDDQTEVLTPRGWLRHDELQTTDDIAGYDLDTGTARWTGCFAVNRYDYDGPMVAVEKRDLSMRLTENHRCIVRRPHSAVPLVDEVVEAGDLGPRHAIPRSAPWEDQEPTKAIGVPMASLCGWIAAEGWYQGRIVRISQSLTANPAKCDDLERLWWRLLPNEGILTQYKERVWRGKPWTDCSWRLPDKLGADVQRLMPDKLLPWSFTRLPEDERRAVLEAFIDGDGHRRPDGRIGIYQKDRHNLDVLQAIAVTLGYKTTLRRGSDKWTLFLTLGSRAISLRSTNGVNAPIGREHYKGIVWCPTTGTGTFFARRNGSVFITGNSFPTELVRRVILGWSPSGVCVECGEGRRPVVAKEKVVTQATANRVRVAEFGCNQRNDYSNSDRKREEATITGYACPCGIPAPPTRPSVVLDVFGGTGTTAGVARALGRIGVSVDLSHDYSRLARWRVERSGHFAKVVNRTNRENQGTLV